MGCLARGKARVTPLPTPAPAPSAAEPPPRAQLNGGPSVALELPQQPISDSIEDAVRRDDAAAVARALGSGEPELGLLHAAAEAGSVEVIGVLRNVE